MIAHIDFPGSSNFRFHHGGKKKVTEWLAEQERLEEERNERTGNVNWYIPSGIVSDKVFRTWKWADGSRIWKNHEYFRLSGEQQQYDFRTDRGRHPRTAAPDWYNHEPQNEPWTNPDK